MSHPVYIAPFALRSHLLIQCPDLPPQNACLWLLSQYFRDHENFSSVLWINQELFVFPLLYPGRKGSQTLKSLPFIVSNNHRITSKCLKENIGKSKRQTIKKLDVKTTASSYISEVCLRFIFHFFLPLAMTCFKSLPNELRILESFVQASYFPQMTIN